MSIPLLEVVLGLTLILVLKWIWRRKQDLQKLQKLGYSVPPVSFIGGNLIELFTRYVTDMKVCLSRVLLLFWKKLRFFQIFKKFSFFLCWHFDEISWITERLKVWNCSNFQWFRIQTKVSMKNIFLLSSMYC